MSTYTKTTWVDHIEDVDTGEVLQQGTLYCARLMNNMENGIESAHEELKNISLIDTKVQVSDSNGHFIEDSDGKKYLSNVLDQLFQFADNGKKSIASTIGNPLSANDTFDDMDTKIEEIKTTLINAMKAKYATLNGNESLKELIDLAITKFEYFSNGIYPDWYTGNITNQSGNKWITAESMPIYRYDLTSSAVDNKIYCIGGYASDILNTNECYDPSTNTWTTKASMTTGRALLTSSVVDNKIYCIGGDDGTINESNNCNECYDPSTNTWTTKASMTTARTGLTSSTVNGKIYCIGGYSGNINYSENTNECYDPSTNTWTTKANMTTDRGLLTSSVVDNKIYCIGGYGSGILKTNECYDPSTNKWTTKADMTTNRNYLTSSAVDNKIYCIGGYGGHDNTKLDVNQCYDPSTNKWTTKANMTTSRSSLASSVVDNKIYCIGGENSGILDTNECYIPSQD